MVYEIIPDVTKLTVGFNELSTSNLVIYNPSDEIDNVMATKNFFVIGCSNCKAQDNRRYGTVTVLDPKTLEKLSVVKGYSDIRQVGKSMSYNVNTANTEQIWYTTTDKYYNLQQFRTLIAFYDTENTKWEIWQNPEIIFEYDLDSDDGDFTVFTSDMRNIYFKSNSEWGLETFQVCPFNEYQDIETDYKGDYIWTERQCKICDK